MNFIKIRCLYVFLIVLFTSMAVYSNEIKRENGDLLSVDKIFNSKTFESKKHKPVKWLKNNKRYSVLEPSKSVKNGIDIVGYNLEDGKREVIVPSQKLFPEGKNKPLKIDEYMWSPNGKLLIIFTNSKRVWRKKTRGDYWVLDLLTLKLKKLGGKIKPSTLMFAKFSPDHTRVGYVRENNIYVENLKDHTIVQLTKDGSKTIINGTFDWVYEEEFGLRDGFRWSPDGKKIAFWQLDSSTVKNFYMINNTDGLYSKIITVPYPKTGETNSSCRIGIINSQGGEIKWLKLPGDSRNNYIARMEWANNSDEVVLQYLNRLQNTNRVIIGDSETGNVKTILIEKDKTWVDVVDDLKWLKKGKYFTWISERDGWRHVYVVSRSGKRIRFITPGPYDVIRVQHIDEKKGWLYYIASPRNPTQRYLYRTHLFKHSKPKQLTPENHEGTHGYRISPDSKWAIHTFSTFETPPQRELIKLPGHKKIRSLADNAEILNNIKQIKRSPVEFFRVTNSKGITFDAWCIKPPDFNPKKKYPLLFFVYGEPAGQTVLDRWAGKRTLWHWMLAQRGYVIMSVDNRGTPSPRGRAWRKSIYGKIGIIASEDQADVARNILKKKPYIDPDRIGIWGWSGGGSMSLNMIFRYPEIYKTAMAIAFVSNQRYYDSIYQERYMGLPRDNPKGYKKGSPITHAHRLKGNLLIVHGSADDNVHYQNCEALVNELIKHNKHFTLMVYPNRSHSIKEGKNTRRHLYTLLTRYLKENLPSVKQ